MMLQVQKNFLAPATLALASAGILGTSQRIALDRTLPIEEIIVFVDAVVTSAGAITIPAKTAAAVVSPAQLDTLQNILKKVTLEVYDGVQPRTVVNASGIGLLERNKLISNNLDTATLGLMAACQGTSVAANTCFRIAYRIPLVHPMLGEAIRSHCLLPVHLHAQDPVLTLEFESAANLSATATPFAAVTANILLIRRRMNRDESDKILKNGGFIKSDIYETPFAVAPGVSGEQRFPIPVNGSYTDLCFRQYLGGANVTRNVLDATGDGSTVAAGFGTEQRWRLESGLQVYNDWRWKHLKTINDFSRPLNSHNQTYSPESGGIVAATTIFNPPSVTCLDFLSDGVGLGDSVYELGGVLDCNIAAQTGLKMEVIGSVASVATNGSVLYVIGQRLYGDLSPWQLNA